MQICDRTKLYRVHSADNEPSCTVEPGETFGVRTQLNNGDWLQSLDDEWDPAKLAGPNLTNCIRVRGARPGCVLAVEILDIQLDRLGYTGFASWRNDLCQRIFPNDWGKVYKVVEIEDNQILWHRGLRLAASPMIGTLGVAPARGEMSNRDASRIGGNMDVQEVCPGATVYLPVEVPGALLHVGDVHAVMGDGEINRAGGVECRSLVTLRTRLLPPNPDMGWVRLENAQYIMAVACLEDLEEAFCQGVRELIRWMTADYGFRPEEAYRLLGQVLEARCTVMVSRYKSYLCKVKKQYLVPEGAL